MELTSISILLLEDQPLIALDVEETLGEAGCKAVTVISSRADAEAWLLSNRPDVVILDVQLRDGECVPLIGKLLTERIPFVIHSAVEKNEYEDWAVMEDVAWVGKPADAFLLVAAISSL